MELGRAADLAEALAPRQVAVLDGLTHEGERCTLVAWDLGPELASVEEALAAAANAAAPGEPPLLYAAVGSIDWDGRVRFRLPGSAALFCEGRETPWVRGELPLPGCRRAAPLAGDTVGARILWTRDDFSKAVRAAQARMEAGEIEKVILSVPFEAPCSLSPVEVYERLAGGTGLAFLLPDGPGGWLVGRSPEPLVLLTGRKASMHLLAGTRRAGSEGDLLDNPKDQSEHMIAVERAHQDLLSVCEPGSVSLDACMAVERHPGLIHLASRLSGDLREDATSAQLVAACFPAGTVGGVPREAARALIDELEPLPREWYAGAVGALLPQGDLQLWLTIRSLRLAGGVARLRTGAGLVRESVPELEWQECLNKARPTLAAIGAEVIDDDRT